MPAWNKACATFSTQGLHPLSPTRPVRRHRLCSHIFLFPSRQAQLVCSQILDQALTWDHAQRPTQALRLQRPTQALRLQRPTQALLLQRPTQALHLERPTQVMPLLLKLGTAGTAVCASSWLRAAIAVQAGSQSRPLRPGTRARHHLRGIAHQQSRRAGLAHLWLHHRCRLLRPHAYAR